MGEEPSGHVPTWEGGKGRGAWQMCVGKVPQGRAAWINLWDGIKEGCDEPGFAFLHECGTLGGFNFLSP